MPTYENPLVEALSARASRSSTRRTKNSTLLRNYLMAQASEAPVGGGGASVNTRAANVPTNRPRTSNVKGGSELDRFINAIVGQESGGRYNALGVPTHGSRAYGRYQIMGYNIPAWAKEALGRAVSPEEFLRSPQIQDAIAKYKLTQYYQKYGAAGAAKAWYGGEGSARRNSESGVYGGPSLNQYARDILARMAGKK